MFNLIGSLLFGQRVTDMETYSSTPEEITTTGLAEASTQTSTHANMQQSNTTSPDTSIINHYTFIGPLNYNESLPRHNSLDWVIVDRSEEADKCFLNKQRLNEAIKLQDTGINTSILLPNETDNINPIQIDQEPEKPQLTMFERSDDDNDVILGSFFEKNEHESEQDKSRYTHIEQSDDDEEDQAKNWQITPLPCLTSKASTSNVEETIEDPLENLLIEHPSMSVFVSATSASNSPLLLCKAIVTETLVEDDDETDMLSMLFTVNEIAKPVKKSSKKVKQVTIAVSHDLVTMKPAEKRKESESHHHMISVVNNFNSSPPSPTITPLIKRKKGKKSAKKSLIATSDSLMAQSPIAGLVQNSNKENIQIKTYLLNELKHKNSSSMSKSRSVDGLLNKNQMKRANRNNTFSSKQSLNQKQRKYHQLQQPAGGFSSTNMQF